MLAASFVAVLTASIMKGPKGSSFWNTYSNRYVPSGFTGFSE